MPVQHAERVADLFQSRACELSQLAGAGAVRARAALLLVQLAVCCAPQLAHWPSWPAARAAFAAFPVKVLAMAMISRDLADCSQSASATETVTTRCGVFTNRKLVEHAAIKSSANGRKPARVWRTAWVERNFFRETFCFTSPPPENCHKLSD